MRENAPATLPAELWTINQAAEALNVHRRFIDRRIYDGTLTVYKINGYHVRLDAAEVRALVTIVPRSGGAR